MYVLLTAGNLRHAESRLPKAVPANTVLQVRLAEPHDARGVLPFAVRRPGAAALHALLRHPRRTELSASPPPVPDQAGRGCADRRRHRHRRHRQSAHLGLGVVPVVVDPFARATVPRQPPRPRASRFDDDGMTTTGHDDDPVRVVRCQQRAVESTSHTRCLRGSHRFQPPTNPLRTQTLYPVLVECFRRDNSVK